MKNPKNQLILFSIALVLALTSITITLVRHDFIVTWELFFYGMIFPNISLAVGFIMQITRSYKEMEKVA